VSFRLLVSVDGKSWLPSTDGALYVNAGLAAIAATRHNDLARANALKTRYRVSQVAQDDGGAWQFREAARFKDGTYKRVPWEHEHWYVSSPESMVHFVHISEQDKTMVAYTAHSEDGINDRQTRVRAGRYLKQFYGQVLSDPQIADWCAMMGVVVEDNDVKFAMTPDAIEYIYTNGPHSCMKHPRSFWGRPMHPAAFLGGGDIGVAYLERDGHITARTICWPERKVHVYAVYGDQVRLRHLLAKRGFRETTVQTDWEGARILRYPVSSNSLALPTGVSLYVPFIHDDGETLRLRNKHEPGMMMWGYGEALYKCRRCRRFTQSVACDCKPLVVIEQKEQS
jgi:hypothetical protein